MIKCKTFSRNHKSSSGIKVDDDVNYFIEQETKKGKFELISQSLSVNIIPHEGSGRDNSEEHRTISIFYRTD